MNPKTFTIKGTGKIIANGYNRVVIGDQGPYVEFEDSDFSIKLETTPGQEYRGKGKYANVKYLWLMPIGYPDTKVYHQLRTVSYADYKVGKYYISPDDLSWDDDTTALYAEEGNAPGIAKPTMYRKNN